jgi:hypothetical protein
MARNLTNGYSTFISLHADSCLTNQFDAEDAVSEVLLYNPNGGAVAYIGNTRFSWIGLGDDFQRAFFHQMVSTRHLGLLNDSRCNLLQTAGAYSKWVIFTLNLMGNPETPVRIPATKLAQAMWIHGHSMQIEVPDSLARTWKAGFYIEIEGKPNSDNWFHFAIPSKVIVNDQRLRVGSVMLLCETLSTDRQ